LSLSENRRGTDGHCPRSVVCAVCSLPAWAQDGKPKPAVWMCPPSHEGGRALRELFERPEQWAQTRKAVAVLGYADHVLNRQFGDDELKQWFSMLQAWKLKFALEVGAVKPWGTTGEKVFAAQRPMWDRFHRLGASIHAIALDESPWSAPGCTSKSRTNTPCAKRPASSPWCASTARTC